jgi:hypothetical protein
MIRGWRTERTMAEEKGHHTWTDEALLERLAYIAGSEQERFMFEIQRRLAQRNLDAAKGQLEAAGALQRLTRGLRNATWTLAIATLVLALATVALVIVTLVRH